MLRRLLIAAALCWSLAGLAQEPFRHLDFVGAGHDKEVRVTASSETGGITAQRTVDGFRVQDEQQLIEASRFLAQSTFGADYATIEMTAAMGYEAWLDEQFELPVISVLQEMVLQGLLYGEQEAVQEPIFSTFFRTAWMTNTLSSPDLLRQRMAFSLSQILVTNDNSDEIEDIGQTVADYYDVMQRNAFGGYEELLLEVTLHPMMGSFLSHLNNPKADLERNIHPDENYAREIMQLFSIGLWELNPNGTRKTDSLGQFIPTYTNADIKEFAQVFTGLGDGTAGGVFGQNDLEDEDRPIVEFFTTPMQMFEDFHDTTSKVLLNGRVLPGNQPGMQDVEQTVEHLAAHPNTAPFIARSLIRFFTTSNPSPSYIQAVAEVFDPKQPDNFREVIRAILLHPEARVCDRPEEYTFGKLREPMVRFLNFMKAFHLSANPYQDYLDHLEEYGEVSAQFPLGAPSVFNFFLPEYQPQGPIGQANLMGPEFQILNASTSIGTLNDLHFRVTEDFYLYGTDEIFEDEDEEEEEEEEEDEEDDEEDEEDEPEFTPEELMTHAMDFSLELELAEQPELLVQRLNILLANGQLRSETRATITKALTQLEEPDDRLRMALFLVMMSPDYVVLR